MACPHAQFTVRGHGKRTAIEHQLILRTHHIHIQHRHSIFCTALGHGRLTLGLFAHMKGRCIEVQQHLRPGRDCLGCRVGRPDILTDGNAHANTVQLKYQSIATGLKITHLVKHPIVWQLMLAINRLKRAVTQQRRRVVKLAVLVQRQTDQNSNVAAVLAKLLQRIANADFQAGAQQQIFGWITGQGQLGKQDQMGTLLPRHLKLIERIDDLHARRNPTRKTSILEHDHVKMGELSFIMAHRINGVSALHTDLMKETVFEELNRLHPDRIVNETNGVTPRRWLLSCNPALSSLIDDVIDNDWVGHLDRLTEIEPHIDDASFLDRYAAAKKKNKVDLANFVRDTEGILLDPDAMYDIQIKRIHEYKRQHLNIIETIALWHEMRENPNADWTPRVKIFAGKAAPGYVFAKKIIHLINDVARTVNSDPVTSKLLKVAYLPNYNVTLAERLIPAADLSEQISTAGKEASGTGNMKFALNGALTIGTLDGANVEIREHVGAENFFLFGMTAPEVVARRSVAEHAKKAIDASPHLAGAIAAIESGAFSPGEPDRYADVADNLRWSDYFLVCSDFAAYYDKQREVDRVYQDQKTWMRMAAYNTARTGWFSSDRTIRGYMNDVWAAHSVTS